MAYLYNYVGKPEKTNKKVKYILDNFYTNTPDGLIGNEDCGQMSAWYVLSAMGVYQVTPGIEKWEINEPFLDAKVSIEGNKPNYLHLPNDRGILPQFGMENVDKPAYQLIIPVPVIQAASKAFKDKLEIELKSQNPKDVIYYLETIDGEDYSTMKRAFAPYLKPFKIEKTCEIQAYVKTKEGQSNTISSTFFKKPNNYTINIKSKYNPQYHAGGAEGLLDGILGTENWRKGDWQGYQTHDFEAVVDLQTKKNIQEISANFLQDTRAWIVMPTEVSFYVSDDNVTFRKVATIANTIPANDYEVQTKKITEKLNTSGRYVKVIAKNFGKLPEWHQGFPFDGEAFIFIDEIEVK